MTPDTLLSLSLGTVLHHTQATNADGSPLRARVNGKPKIWKTRPGEFMLPMKHGLRHCFYITQHNIQEWTLPTDTTQ